MVVVDSHEAYEFSLIGDWSSRYRVSVRHHLVLLVLLLLLLLLLYTHKRLLCIVLAFWVCISVGHTKLT